MTNICTRLESLETLGIKFGLDNIRAILKELGNPEESFLSVLIAGTNGKGSVAAMLEAILRKNSFRTGIYTSPHLLNVRERIRVQGDAVSEMDFERMLSRVFDAADATLPSPPTYFEVLTAAAMLHFKEMHIDYGVIEVGMGGRYDATNAISQKLSIITSIDYDHETYLGRTLEGIAAEKAAISKPKVPMITGILPAEAVDVVREACRQTESLYETATLSNILEPKLEQGHGVFVYRPWNMPVRVNLRGRHQIENAAVALLASEQLFLDRHLTLQALSEVHWPGRLDIVPGYTPPVVLDCAHNPMGARSLAEFIRDMKWDQAIILFAAMRDKNIGEMLRAISPRVDQAILTRVEPLCRCASREDLLAAASANGIDACFEPDVANALQQAFESSGKSNRPLVVFGSIYLIGKIFSLLDLAT